MPPNTLRVHTEYELVKSVCPKSCGPSHERRYWRIFPSPSVPFRNCGGGDRGCRHLSSLWRISPSSIVLSPVWYSRPTTGVLLAPCHDEFRGSRSDYVRQVALETTTTTVSQHLIELVTL
ncbi:uncharacterized protein TNCV_1410401 [Trichonephila clavipes]|nr:uncharacterized protein TNCV_1410401 [Trichonephila clavipes]